MTRTAKCVEVKSPDGKLMFSLEVYDLQMPTDQKTAASQGTRSQANSQGSAGQDGQSDPSLMTGAQKRYLFRILAERGLDGDKAHQHLKERFGVDSLTEVTKREASSMIEQFWATVLFMIVSVMNTHALSKSWTERSPIPNSRMREISSILLSNRF